VEVPTLAQARQNFTTWLLSGEDGEDSDEALMLRALGLRKG
jgi:hypothetical protein